MQLGKLLKKEESLIAVDVGFGSVKLIELELGGAKPRLLNIGTTPFQESVFNNNVISKPEKVGELVADLFETNAIKDKRIVTAVPGPSVFTKKIKVPKAEPAELRDTLRYEAGNFIPHSLDAVSVDFHIIGESGRNELDVLVVAVKNEIVDSYLESFAQAGLEVAVMDVDSFAIQNAFELRHPELVEKTVALINIGARYSSINICKRGQSLFTGDMGMGGKQVTDAMVEGLSLSFNDAELVKKGKKAPADADSCKAIVDKQVEYLASEFNRQLSFFWNASGAEEGIDLILLSGGGSQLQGFAAELNEKTGIEVGKIDPLAAFECGESFDKAYLEEMSPFMAVCAGLAIRKPGDRE